MSLRYLDSDEPLVRYLTIKAEMQRLKEELDELKPLITAALWEEPDNCTTYLGHEIKLGTRKSYEYSAAVQELERDLASKKAAERSSGEAVVVRETSFPVVKATQ